MSIRTVALLFSFALASSPALGAVSASPTTLAFGGQSMNTTSPVLTTTVTNTSGASITIADVSVSTGYTVASHTCGAVPAGGSCTVGVRFTPLVAGATVPFNGTLTLEYTSGSTAVTLAGTAERSLVTHYYRSILRRAPDASGKVFWEGDGARVSGLGASVNEAWFAMALEFYFSTEYAAFNRDNTGFVTDLYNTFFNRAPDGAGLAFWVGQLTSGMPREVALASFMFSTEFANFTTAIFGNVTARAEVNAIVDFYRGLLARTPDSGGFNFWVGRFRTAQCLNAAAVTNEVEAISSAFALSAEYTGRNRTNAQYIGDLYNAFLRRGGDLAGVQFWINQVASGAQSREQVRVQFRNSPEFQARVKAILGQGCFDPGAPPSNVIVYSDTANPLLLGFTPTNGKATTLFGRKDSSGNAVGIDGLFTQVTPFGRNLLMLDASGLPATVAAADGATMKFSWNGNNSEVTYSAPSGEFSVSTNMVVALPPKDAPKADLVNGTLRASVKENGAPASNATVWARVAPKTGGSGYSLPLSPTSAGVYSAGFVNFPSTLPPGSAKSACSNVISKADTSCKVIEPTATALLGGGCIALAGLATALATPVAGGLTLAACESVAADAEAACLVISVAVPEGTEEGWCSAVESAVSFFDPDGITVHVSATRGATAGSAAKEFAGTATLAELSVDLLCPPPTVPLNGTCRPPQPTALTVTMPSNLVLVSQPVTISAEIKMTSGNPNEGSPITGAVTFYANESPVCVGVSVTSSGGATCNTSFSTPGERKITAGYTGDPNYAPSNGQKYMAVVAEANSHDACMGGGGVWMSSYPCLGDPTKTLVWSLLFEYNILFPNDVWQITGSGTFTSQSFADGVLRGTPTATWQTGSDSNHFGFAAYPNHDSYVDQSGKTVEVKYFLLSGSRTYSISGPGGATYTGTILGGGEVAPKCFLPKWKTL